MKKNLALPVALAFSLLLAGPALAKETEQTPAKATETTKNYDGRAIKGSVVKTMDAGGYTYLKIKEADQETWVAIPQTKVEVGQVVTAGPGMVMPHFTSKKLNKTFDSIIFSSGLVGPGKAVSPQKATDATGDMSFSKALQAESGRVNPHAAGAMGGAMGGGALESRSGGSASAIVPASEIKIKKASGANAQTVAECFDNAKKLNNTTIQLRGKVMKVSKMIMGKNWVHLQDGTGNAIKNSHDLVVTTQADPEVGSVVVIEGTLHADKDFGAGYRYAVIIEDAVIK